MSRHVPHQVSLVNQSPTVLINPHAHVRSWGSYYLRQFQCTSSLWRLLYTLMSLLTRHVCTNYRKWHVVNTHIYTNFQENNGHRTQGYRIHGHIIVTRLDCHGRTCSFLFLINKWCNEVPALNQWQKHWADTLRTMTCTLIHLTLTYVTMIICM